MKPDRKSLNKEYNKKGGQGGFMAQRIPAFFTKKSKKRTRPGNNGCMMHDAQVHLFEVNMANTLHPP